MEIIRQLQKPEFKFLLLGKWNIWGRNEVVDNRNKLVETKQFPTEDYSELIIKKIWLPLGKAPIENNWTVNNYKFSDAKLIEHMKTNNIGIIGGYGGLRVLDIDNIKFVDYFKAKFKDTLIIQSGTGGIHVYFLSDYDTNFNLKDKMGEYRAKNRYVVAPGSTHPNSKKYIVINDKELKRYTKEEIQKIVEPFVKKDTNNSISKVQEPDQSRSGLEYRKVLALLRSGKTKEEIFENMKAYSKWTTAPEQYREYTYKSAVDYIKNQKEIVDDKNFNEALAHIVDPQVLAKEFCKRVPTFYDTNKMFWMWNKNEYRWERVDATTILNKISANSYYDTINAKKRTEILESLRQVGRLNEPKQPSKYWIQFKNKIVDIKTGEEFEASPEWFIFNPIPWEMGKDEKTPIIDQFLKEWVLDKSGKQDISYVQTLKEVLAYSCLPHMPINRIICLKGDGANGKSTFLKLISKILGQKNITASSVERLTHQNFEISKLYRKLAIIITEVDSTIFKRTAIIKALSGEDILSIEFKGKDPFDFYNYAKPLISVNTLPETRDRTKGFYRRWTIIDFPNTYDETADILEKITDNEIQNFCKQIPEILKNLIQKGKFTNDGTIADREIRYNVRSTPIREFISELCEVGEDFKESFSNLYYAYINFLSESGYESFTISKRVLGQILNTLNYAVFNEKGVAYRRGLKLKYHGNNGEELDASNL